MKHFTLRVIGFAFRILALVAFIATGMGMWQVLNAYNALINITSESSLNVFRDWLPTVIIGTFVLGIVVTLTFWLIGSLIPLLIDMDTKLDKLGGMIQKLSKQSPQTPPAPTYPQTHRERVQAYIQQAEAEAKR